MIVFLNVMSCLILFIALIFSIFIFYNMMDVIKSIKNVNKFRNLLEGTYTIDTSLYELIARVVLVMIGVIVILFIINILFYSIFKLETNTNTKKYYLEYFNFYIITILIGFLAIILGANVGFRDSFNLKGLDVEDLQFIDDKDKIDYKDDKQVNKTINELLKRIKRSSKFNIDISNMYDMGVSPVNVNVTNSRTNTDININYNERNGNRTLGFRYSMDDNDDDDDEKQYKCSFNPNTIKYKMKCNTDTLDTIDVHTKNLLFLIKLRFNNISIWIGSVLISLLAFIFAQFMLSSLNRPTPTPK